MERLDWMQQNDYFSLKEQHKEKYISKLRQLL